MLFYCLVPLRECFFSLSLSHQFLTVYPCLSHNVFVCSVIFPVLLVCVFIYFACFIFQLCLFICFFFHFVRRVLFVCLIICFIYLYFLHFLFVRFLFVVCISLLILSGLFVPTQFLALSTISFSSCVCSFAYSVSFVYLFVCLTVSSQISTHLGHFLLNSL